MMNDECLKNDEYPMTKPDGSPSWAFGLRASSFFSHSSFVIPTKASRLRKPSVPKDFHPCGWGGPRIGVSGLAAVRFATYTPASTPRMLRPMTRPNASPFSNARTGADVKSDKLAAHLEV